MLTLILALAAFSLPNAARGASPPAKPCENYQMLRPVRHDFLDQTIPQREALFKHLDPLKGEPGFDKLLAYAQHCGVMRYCREEYLSEMKSHGVKFEEGRRMNVTDDTKVIVLKITADRARIAACDFFESRAKEKQAQLDSAPPEQRDALARGWGNVLELFSYRPAGAKSK